MGGNMDNAEMVSEPNEHMAKQGWGKKNRMFVIRVMLGLLPTGDKKKLQRDIAVMADA